MQRLDEARPRHASQSLTVVVHERRHSDPTRAPHFQARRISGMGPVARSHRLKLDSDNMCLAVGRGWEVHRPFSTVRCKTTIRLVPRLSERLHTDANPLPGVSP